MGVSHISLFSYSIVDFQTVEETKGTATFLTCVLQDYLVLQSNL